MKLIYYTTGRLAIVILIIMAFWSVFFYVRILDEVQDETDDRLEDYRKTIVKQALLDSAMLEGRTDILTRYYIRALSESEGRGYKDEFLSTEVFNEYEMDEEPVRILKTAFRTNEGSYYELVVMTSTLEEDDMLESILWSIVWLSLLMVVSMVIVLQLVFRKSMRPFYKLIRWLDNYTLERQSEPLENKTQITEFKRLNTTIEDMVKRNEVTYTQQKQFIENASHELQTPLAISLNKLELLSENQHCTEEQMKELGEIHQTLSRLVRLNKSLLLLSRIDNRQYKDEKKIELNLVIHSLAADLEDVYEERGIHIRIQESGEFNCVMNEALGNVLISNLLKNAVVHSPDGAQVNISINSRELLFSNKADGAALDGNRVFERFYTAGGRKTESTGLGLSVVKSIAGLYGLQVFYFFDGMHNFKVVKP